MRLDSKNNKNNLTHTTKISQNSVKRSRSSRIPSKPLAAWKVLYTSKISIPLPILTMANEAMMKMTNKTLKTCLPKFSKQKSQSTRSEVIFLSKIKFLSQIIQNMSLEMEQALNLGLKRLINEITRNGELSKFESYLQQRKAYDQIERQYIQNQRLRKQLGSQYESSDSEQEKENNYNSLSQLELKKIMRKALVQRKFDESVLEPITEIQMKREQSINEFTTTKLFAEDVETIREISCNVELNVIKEVREAVQDQIEKESNFGLEFLIHELKRIEKVGLQKCLI